MLAYFSNACFYYYISLQYSSFLILICLLHELSTMSQAFKKNVWVLFKLLLIASLCLVITLLYFRYHSIKDRYLTQVEHYSQMVTKTIHSDFLQEEMVLEMVGRQVLENKAYNNTTKAKRLLDSILIQNPYLLGFGLAKTDGTLVLLSSSIKASQKINLATDERTRDGFSQALKSHNMVVGRTYFYPAIGKWIIPLRKAIRDDKGNVIGVMTSAVINERNTNYLDNLDFSNNMLVVIANDMDSQGKIYRQYYSLNSSLSLEKLYQVPLSKETIASINQSLMNKYHFSLSDFKANIKSVSFEAKDYTLQNRIIGMSYDKKYNLFIMVGLPAKAIWNDFLFFVLLYLVVYTIIFIIIFFLFSNIAKAEQQKSKELTYLAEHDVLTTLPNRTYMYNHIKQWQKQHPEVFDVLYIDLDNFKNVNDKFGHTIGDKILVDVSKRLVSFFDQEAMIIRQGGDEFIVFKECIDEANKYKHFSSLIHSISQTYYIDNKEFRIGMSVGVAQYPLDGKNIEVLLSLADTAMYESKKVKNSYSFFSEKMRRDNTYRADIEQELRGAIDNHELSMVYQPQINAIDGSLYGVEALVRWNNKKLGFVGPDIFIAVAEVCGLMHEIGQFVIITSLREIKKLQLQMQMQMDFRLSINISVIQLMEDDFLDLFLSLVETEAFDKSKLTIEVTESLSIEDLDKVLPLLHAIRNEGIELSLDDFGTGYSSLNILKELPINELKIDKSFIDDILMDSSQKALVQSIINIGKNFNMKTLAEGVETKEQAEALKADYCDIFQGYYYSKPLAYDDLLHYVTSPI